MLSNQIETTDFRKYTVCELIPILNVIDFPAEYIILYVWFLNKCNPNWEIDYKELIFLSGIKSKKISVGIAYLEGRGLIEVNRSVKGKLIISVNSVPDHIIEKYEYRLEEVKLRKKVQEMNQKLKKSS